MDYQMQNDFVLFEVVVSEIRAFNQTNFSAL